MQEIPGGSPYPRPSAPMPPTRFAADLAIGIIVAVLWGICFLCQVGGLAMAGAVTSQAGAGSEFRAAMQEASMAQLVLGILVTLAICISGIGVAMGTRWGFLLGAIATFANVIMSVIQMATGGMQTMTQQPGVSADQMKAAYTFGMILGVVFLLLFLAYGVYCVMRLIGKVGPPPR